MTDFIDFLNKQMLPILALIIALIGLFKGWVRPRQMIFEQREKISKHSFEMYKISNDESLKRLAIEYGYAAITKDNFLTLNQRKALVNSVDPVRDIELFSDCRYLLDIKTEPLAFEWKKRRYNSKIYFNFARVCRFFLYGLGSFIFTLPITYGKFFPLIDQQTADIPNLTKGWLVIYCITIGGLIAWMNLNAGRKITLSSRLIKKHLTRQI